LNKYLRLFLLCLQSASYERCSASDELIKNFWTVFFEFSEENKKKFLSKLTHDFIYLFILTHLLHHLKIVICIASHPHSIFFCSVLVWDGPCTSRRFLKAFS